MKLNVAHIEPESYIYAPGKQFVIWVQGCLIKCKGCWNKEMWDFQKDYFHDINTILTQIQLVENLNGVTILGGEPFDQPEGLYFLVEKIKNINLGVTIYTGYTLNELSIRKQHKVLDKTDLLMSGRYVEKLRNINLQWIGSENQQVLHLTDYYKDTAIKNANYCEVNITDLGEVTILGFPEEKLIKDLL